MRVFPRASSRSRCERNTERDGGKRKRLIVKGTGRVKRFDGRAAKSVQRCMGTEGGVEVMRDTWSSTSKYLMMLLSGLVRLASDGVQWCQQRGFPLCAGAGAVVARALMAFSFFRLRPRYLDVDCEVPLIRQGTSVARRQCPRAELKGHRRRA